MRYYNICVKILLSVFVLLTFKLGDTTAQNIENSTMKREFKEVIKEEWRFVPSEFELFRAEIYTINNNHSALFVFDYTKKNLFKLSIEGSEIVDMETIGNGQGSGPGEFRNPTDMCVSLTSKGEKLVLIDSDLARVSIWDVTSGEFEKSFNPKKFSPSRVSCTPNKIFLYNATGSKNGDYLVYNFDKELIAGIKDNRKKRNTFLDAGEIVADDSSLFFSSKGRSELKKFSLIDNAFELSNSLVEAVVENKTDIKEDKKTRTEKRSKDFKYQTRGIGEYGDYILVLYSGEKHGHGNTIDFYNKRTLVYEFSVQLEFWSISMDVQGDRIILDSYYKDRKEYMFMAYKIELVE